MLGVAFFIVMLSVLAPLGRLWPFPASIRLTFKSLAVTVTNTLACISVTSVIKKKPLTRCHQNLWKNECTLCSKVFSQRAALARHIEQVSK